jgi:leader peptidase (prepilin peptidase) / N-methyltransferase
MPELTDAELNPWAAVPGWFWASTFFVLGTIVGSFLNVCIHRLPRGQSIVTPRSHCPHCGYMIPGYLNIPLFTWVYLRGKCANCGAPISARYFLVELLTGVTFLACWLAFGAQSPALALAYCVVLGGFIAATFIDFEHFIIPDEITLGGIVAGFLASGAVPLLHQVESTAQGLKQSAIGIAVGAGLIYGVLRMGKLLFGRQKLKVAPNTKIIFTESSLHIEGEEFPYEEIFYRKSDTIALQAHTVELVDRCYKDTSLRLSPNALLLGGERFSPEEVPFMEVVADQIILPREAMGLGDVKFMAAIGAFLGWQAVIFSLMFSAVLGSIVGLALIVAGRQSWSSRLPYGPYIALAATLWIFAGPQLWEMWFGG